MKAASVSGERGAFTDLARESCTLPSRYYLDPEIHAREMRRIFRRSWLYAGHVTDLPEVGSYLTEELAGQPILILRSRDGEIRAFFNVCQHRGHILLTGRGQLKSSIVCPYHAWCYDSQGRLVGAPHMAERPGFDRASICLPEFRSEIWQGFVFVTLDPETPPLAPRLSDLDGMIGNYHLEEMTLHYVAEAVWETNWKCLMENFMEGYHLSPLHRTTLHPVNPTKLCRHFPPGDGYFGYTVGFSPELERTTRGHPDLREAEADTCVMFAVPPGLAVGGAADYSSFICLQPETVDRVRVKQGLYFHGDDWPRAAIDQAVDLFERTMAEDKEMLLGLRRGLHAASYATGPLAPADYEGPIWDFIQHIARRLQPALETSSG